MAKRQEKIERAIVVVGASAGGIDALERLAASLPAGLPAPVVVAQHAAGGREKQLLDILRARTALDVAIIDGRTILENGTIYIVPAGRNAEVTDGSVRAENALAGSPSPSIDRLFASAARAYGDRTLGIVLSGIGSDGPAGALAIKEAGGTIVVQDPATAAFAALPGSIPPAICDITSDVETMGSLIPAMIQSAHSADNTIDEDALRRFLEQLRSRSGIDFTQYKTPTIRRRLARLMAAAHVETLQDYMRYLNAHPEAYQRLVSSFLIKVTGFFRDPALFKSLQEQILPELIAEARAKRRELRLWSAGCATGEEAYSLAISVAEVLGDRLGELDIRIFATDLDEGSIAFARRGLYVPQAFSEMPAALMEKYFTPSDGCYQIKKRIRNLTVFGEYDLAQRAPFPRIDLILCRNVLIYFTKDLQQRTLQLFAFSLRDGGYLVLGKSETTSPLPQYFSAVHPALKVFRRHGERPLVPAPAFGGGSAPPERPTMRRNALRSFTVPRGNNEAGQRGSFAERLGTFFFDSPLGVVTVDRTYDIQAINQAARQMLGIHGQGIGEDIVHSASAVAPQQLKPLLDRAFRSKKHALPEEIEVNDLALGEARSLQISCYMETLDEKDDRGPLIILLQDVSAQAKRRRELEDECRANRAELERVGKQSAELMERQRSLMDANIELTAANNDLRNMNEHLLISAEEAEAAAEEVETLNEEMQATSEELETLNEELQATVEELNTTNEELGARGDELERIANARREKLASIENERQLLRAALERMPTAAALVDGDGVVMEVTREYEELAQENPRLPLRGQLWIERPDFGVMATALAIDDGRGKLVVLKGS